MRLSYIFVSGTLLVTAFGCTPLADNNQRRGETQQAGAAGEAAGSPTRDQSAPASSSGGAATNPSSGDNSSEPMPAGEQGGSTSLPFIAETKTVNPVINIARPGRLEVVNGCLTVTVRGHERATAVFPPGVKPQLRGDRVVAVSFEGNTIPLDQEAPIPGGLITSPTVDLVKPIPSYCPKPLFGIGG